MSTAPNPTVAENTEVSPLDRNRMYEASELLLEARRTVTPIPELPANLRPQTLGEAYVLQDIMVAELGRVAGWKIGASSPDAIPIFGPMFDFGIAPSGSIIATHMRRMRGIEAEIAFQLSRDLPLRATPYTRPEVIAAISAGHPAIELLESAYTDPDAVDRFSMIGDLQMHGGFVHGPAYAGWRDFDYAEENVTVAVDGAIRADKGVNNAGPDLLKLVLWLANHGAERTRGLHAGQWITTGSWMGKTLASPGSSVDVHFHHFGDAHLKFAGEPA